MSKRRSTRDKRCPICHINKTLCFCDQIIKHKSETKISIIMHHREKHLTSNTAHLATLALEKASIHLRGLLESPFLIENLNLNKNETPLYLFPDDDAEILSEDFINQYPGPYHLIIPDGNWGQASKVRRREPGLLNILCIKLPVDIKGEYKLRKGPRPDGVCTFEAIAHALFFLENKALAIDLLRQFKVMNDRVETSRLTYSN